MNAYQPLSDRQHRLLLLLSQGLSHAQIAKQVGSTPTAVGSALSKVYLNLGADSGPHAIRIGFETGLLTGAYGLTAELHRVYRALAEANARVSVRSTVPSHPFSDYLLSLGAVA